MPGVPVILFHPPMPFAKGGGRPGGVGVAFGCALMTFCFLASGMENRVEQTFSNLSGRIMVTQKGSVFGGLFQGVGSSSIPDSYIGLIDDVPHVTNVTGQVTAILRPVGSALVMPLFGYGGEEAGGTPFRRIVEGAAPVGDDEVVIGKSLQEYLGFMNVFYETGGVYQFRVSGSKEDVRDIKVVAFTGRVMSCWTEASAARKSWPGSLAVCSPANFQPSVCRWGHGTR